MPTLGGSGSEVSQFIPEPSNFSEVARLHEDVKKYWLKVTLKEIKNLINNQTYLMGDPDKGEPVTLCMNVYKTKIQYDGSIDKLKLGIVLRGNFWNKEMNGGTWYPT